MEEVKSKEEIMHEKNLTFAQKFNDVVDQFEKLYELKSKRKVSSENVKRYLENPYGNVDNLQAVMEYMININGIVKEMINYKSNILTLDHYLLCSDVSKYKDGTKFDNAYRKAVCELKKYNIKFNIRWMMEKLIKDGEVYVYKNQSSDGITFVPIPPQFCKVTSSKGGVQYYSIKIEAITEDTVNAFPDEVKKLYEKKKKGILAKDKKYKDGYYPLDSKNAYAFSLNYLVPKNIPYYSNLLNDLCRLNDMLDLDDANAQVDNFKLIQMLIPSDKDTADILVDPEEATEYFQSVKRVLPNGICVVGLPYKLDSVSLGDSRSKDVDYTNKLKKSTYDSAGINDELFNGSKNNNQGIIYSTILDALLPIKLLEQFRLMLNEDFKNNGSLKNFELCFLDTTQMNKDEKLRLMVSNAATYNSKLQILAGQGLEPHQAYNVLKQEELMGLSNLMNAMENSHTQSGGADNGRPSANKDDINKAPLAQN